MGLHALVEALGADDVVVLLEIFLTDSLDQVRIVAERLASEDLEGARRGAHALKGSAMNMGALALAAACAELEHAPDLPDAMIAFEAMRSVSEEVRVVFGDEMAALKMRATGS